MKRNRNNKFKTGASLIVVLVVMGGIMALLGYTAINWYFDYTSGPQEELKSVDTDQIVKEEKINPEETPNKDSESKESSTAKQVQNKSSSTSTESQQTNVSQSVNNEDLFAVQVGAFSKESNAQGMVKKLKEKGFTAYITSEDPYRVQTGAFRTKKAAKELGSKLKKEGFPVYIKD